MVDTRFGEINTKMVERFIDRSATLSKTHLTSVVSFAIYATKGAFILNGSAAVAVLTKVPLDAMSPISIKVVMLGGVGAALAVMCAGFSYLAQVFFSTIDNIGTINQVLKILGQQEANIPRYQIICAEIFRGIAAVLFLASLCVFFYGLSDLHHLFAASMVGKG